MRRRLKVWLYPSIEKQDTVTVGGWGVSEDTGVSLIYRNTEVVIAFNEDGIQVTTWAVSPKNGSIIGDSLGNKTFRYSQHKDEKDAPRGKYQSTFDFDKADSRHIDAEVRHWKVFTSGKKKKKKG